MNEVDLIRWAADEAERFLCPLGDRWVHTQAVAATARGLAAVGVGEATVLVAAAYLHDIGYAPRLKVTGHHGIDGGFHLRASGHPRLANLVAHHSGCGAEAVTRDLAAELTRFPPEATPTADALTYCDLITDSRGCRVSVDERVSDVLARYGENHAVARGLLTALPEINRAVTQTKARIVAAGRGRQAITGWP